MSVILPILVYGQEETTTTYNEWAISIGAEQASLKDRTFSPTVFSGILPTANLAFRRNNRDQKLISARIRASYGNIEDSGEYFRSTITSAGLSINYLSRIKSTTQSKVFFGGQFKSVLEVLDYNGFESGSWFTAQRLEPILHYQYSLSDEHLIAGQFSYPLLSYVTRPNYAGVDEFVIVNSQNIPKILYSRGQFQSITKVIHPEVELNYYFSMDRIRFTASAHWSYLQVNSVWKYRKLNTGFRIGAQLKILKDEK